MTPQGDCDFFNEGAGGSPLYTAEEKKGYGDLSVAPHIPKNKKEGTVIFSLIHWSSGNKEDPHWLGEGQ